MGTDGVKPTFQFNANKVSGAMVDAVKDAIGGGKTKKVDNKAEYDALKTLLAGTTSADEQAYIKGYQFEYTQKQASQSARDVVGGAASIVKSTGEINSEGEAMVIAAELNHPEGKPEADLEYYRLVLEISGYGHLIPQAQQETIPANPFATSQENSIDDNSNESVGEPPLREVVTEENDPKIGEVTYHKYYDDGDQLVRKEIDRNGRFGNMHTTELYEGNKLKSYIHVCDGKVIDTGEFAYDSYGQVVQYVSHDANRNSTYMEKNVRNDDGTYTRYSSTDGNTFSEEETYTVDGGYNSIISQPNKHTEVNKSFFEQQK